MRTLGPDGFTYSNRGHFVTRKWVVVSGSLRRRYFQKRYSFVKAQFLGIALFFTGMILTSGLVLSRLLFQQIFASDSTQTWNFSASGDYTLSNSTNIEVVDSLARLKVLNYAPDSSTQLLLHFDESDGDPSDSSSGSATVSSTDLTYATGNLNNAGIFDGDSSQVVVNDSAGLSLSSANTLEAWTKFDSAFSAGSHSHRQGVIDKGMYQLYYNNETGKIVYELQDSTATSWIQSAGNELNGGWDLDGQLTTSAMTQDGTNIYVGLGNGVGDAEVWKYTISSQSWSKIGGDDLNNGWPSSTYENVLSLASDSTYVYAGIGLTAGDAEVWRYSISGNTWTKIGGDAINSSWAVNTFEGAYSMTISGGVLYAGLGASANDAEVWSWNGTSWTKIGGDSLNSGWTTNLETVYVLESDANYVYAGLGLTASDADLWRYSISGGTWTQIGGDSLNSGWGTGYEYVLSLALLDGNLYAGLGTTTTEADVWSWNGTSWSQVGGDGVNSSWNTAYEGVYKLLSDGTSIYAGLGSGGGDQEIWQFDPDGASWTKIAGDGVNSSFTGTTHTIVDSMTVVGETVFAGITSNNAARSGQVWQYSEGSWSQIGGDYYNLSWGFRGLRSVEVMMASGDYLYAGTGIASAGNALVWQFDGTSWSLVGGQGVNSSWSADTYEAVTSLISHGGILYAGLGSTAGDAEVWRFVDGEWEQVGGDSLNSGWATGFEEVTALASYEGILYAGLGISANDAEVWSWNGTSWTKIGGDSLNSGWTTNFDRVASMGIYAGNLYVGLGITAGEAEVWRWSGSSWTKVGGDTVNSSWDSSSFEQVDSMIPLESYLYVGLGTGTDDAEVWRYDGTSWTKVGGDDVSFSWTAGTYERVRTLVGYNGALFAGIGNGTGDGEVWRFRDGSWTKIAGNSVNSSWSNAIEEVTSFSVYKGKLFAGLGNTANVDTQVWQYGNNGYLESSTTSQNTDWRHIAATYDGSTMKLFINGVLDSSNSVALTMADTNNSVLVGSTYGGREQGRAQGYFEGSLDEVRVSNTARSSFTTTPYSTSAQTIQPTAAVFTSGVKNLDAFTVSETLNGGSIEYRLSTDGGSTWKYYSSGWVTSASTAQTNTAATIHSNISTLEIGSGGIIWQAVFEGNGNQRVILNEVEIGAISDNTAPSNPDSLTALSSSGGSAISTDTWYGYTAPYFSWSGASDGDGAGIEGYYVYFGTDSSADPQTAGTFQTTSTYTASSLSSGSTYYLKLKTRDNAQNISSEIWTAFTYKFDNTGPAAPGVISVSPAGYAPTNSFTFSWPTSGANAASDGGAGIAGYQYKTATESGTLSDWSSVTTDASVEIDNAAYQVGENTFYLRAVDNSGNVSSSPISTTYYFAGEGPSAPQYLSVTPSTNTVNSFAFSWNPPSSFSGEEDELTYCYTINTLPNADNCTFTSAGATSLSASSFATQVGLNTVYLVAKNSEESGSAINYGAYTSATFTASTSAPGIPLNTDIADISIKSGSLWRLTISWNTPTDTGSGVSSYEIFRSTDAESFSEISSTTGTAYVDTNLEAQEYFYKVRACDSVSNCGAFSDVVQMIPTGKYTEAASLSSAPTASSITTKQATISWSTDRTSDSKVQYGTSAGSYFSSEPSNSTQKTSHEIVLSNLSPGTTYYYKAKWTDEDGNTGFSTERSFTTEPAPIVTDPKPKTLALTSATVEFTVKGASKVKIYYGETSAFGGVKEVPTSTSEAVYTTVLEDLEDGTKYFYKINAIDSEGAEYEGNVLSFQTLPRPKISQVRIQQVRGSAQPTVLVTWSTNTETSSIVTYYPEGQAAEARDEVNVNLKAGQHSVIIRGLKPETGYILFAKGRDKAGNEASSEAQRFTTATDTRPPQISNVKVEGSNSKVGDQQLSQLIVSWTTDEPASSQVEFGEGTGTNYSQRTQDDTNLKYDHLVVISNLTPSRVYHLRAVAKDSAGNVGESVDTVTITPKATEAALDLVVNNLQQVFGFLSK